MCEECNIFQSLLLFPQGGTKLERARDLFEQCLEKCPDTFAKGQQLGTMACVVIKLFLCTYLTYLAFVVSKLYLCTHLASVVSKLYVCA